MRAYILGSIVRSTTSIQRSVHHHDRGCHYSRSLRHEIAQVEEDKEMEGFKHIFKIEEEQPSLRLPHQGHEIINTKEDRAFKEGDGTYIRKVCHLASSGRFPEMKKLMKTMRQEGRKIPLWTFHHIMKQYSRARRPKDALKLLHAMHPLYNCIPGVSSLNLLLRIMLISNSPGDVIQLFGQMNAFRIFPKDQTFTLVLKAYCMKNMFKDAYQLLNEMPNWGCVPKACHYAALIYGLSKAGQIEEAMHVFGGMKKGDESCAPNAMTYTCIIHGLCSNGRIADALRILDEMPFKGLHATVYTFSTIIHSLCKARKISKAISLMHRMKFRHNIMPTVPTYNILINGLCKCRKPDEAYNVLAVMAKRGYYPNVITFCSLIDGFCKANKAQRALEIWNDMKKVCRPNVTAYNSLIDGLCNNALEEKAKELFVEMKLNRKTPPDTVTYTCLIHRLCKTGKIHEADGLWNEMIDKGVSPNIFTYSIVIYGLCETDNLDDALKIWNHMHESGCTPDVISYTAMIRGYCKAGQMDEAQQLFDKMLRHNCVPDVVLFRVFVKGLCKAGMVHRAMDVVLVDMIRLCCDHDSKICVTLMYEIYRSGMEVDMGGFFKRLVYALYQKGRLRAVLDVLGATLGKVIESDVHIWRTAVLSSCKHNKVYRSIQECWDDCL